MTVAVASTPHTLPTIPMVHADFDTQPAGDLWQPFGPYTDTLHVNVFSNAASEFLALEAGDLDLLDSPVPLAGVVGYGNNPDVLVSQPVNEAYFAQIDVNNFAGLFGLTTIGSNVDAIAVWCHTNPNNNSFDIYYSIWDDTSQVWWTVEGGVGTSRPIAGGLPGSDLYPEVSFAPNGQAIAVWTHYTGNFDITGPSGEVYYSRFIGPGTGWTTPAPIVNIPEEDANPAIAFKSNGEAVAVWAHVTSEGMSSILYRVWSGSTWTTPINPLAEPISSASLLNDINKGPQIAVDTSNRYIAIWAEPSSVSFSLREPATNNWSPPQPISSSGPGFNRKGISPTTLGNAEAIWSDSTTNTVRLSNWNGAAFSSATPLPGASPYLDPAIVFNQANDAIAVFHDIDQIWYSKKTGTSWQNTPASAGNFLTSGGPEYSPRLAFVGSGRAVLVWLALDQPVYRVWTGTDWGTMGTLPAGNSCPHFNQTEPAAEITIASRIGSWEQPISTANLLNEEPLTSNSRVIPDMTMMQPNPSSIQLNQGLAHLIDKERFVAETMNVPGVAVDCANAPVAGGCLGANPNSWDTLHPGTISAYNLVADLGLGGGPGPADIAAAKEHFAAAGLVDSDGDGLFDFPGAQIQFLIRNDDVNLFSAGNILMNAINSIFETGPAGQQVVQATYGSIIQLGLIVFRGFGDDATEKDWNLYTGAWGTEPDASHLSTLYHSQFASNVCGGKQSVVRLNYGFVCDPDLDQFLNELGLGCITIVCFNAVAKNALDVLGQKAHTIPLYSRTGRFLSHNGWNGIVSTVGHGYPSTTGDLWIARPNHVGTFLNARQIPGYVSTGGLGLPGGGNQNLLRFGMQQGTSTLNIFHASSVWEQYILLGLGIYDTPFSNNPVTSQLSTGESFNWATTRTEEIFAIDLSLNPLGPDGLPGTGDEGKITIIRLHLRNDLTFHNGAPVTPNDIIKSYFAYRDVPAGGLGLAAATSNLITAQQIGSNIVQLVWNGHSFLNKYKSNLPILPVNLWDTNGDGFICGGLAIGTCTGPGGVALPADQSTSATFDPMTAGILVGSGPMRCYTNFNVSGQGTGGLVDPSNATCSLDPSGSPGNQVVGPGGRFLLDRFDKYHRCCPALDASNFHRFSWADINDDGKVDINDIANIAFDFGTSDPYWDSPFFGTTPGIVDIGEVSVAAFYFDHGLISPFASLSSKDPDNDPICGATC